MENVCIDIHQTAPDHSRGHNETSTYSPPDIHPGSSGVLLHEKDHHSQRKAEFTTLSVPDPL